MASEEAASSFPISESIKLEAPSLPQIELVETPPPSRREDYDFSFLKNPETHMEKMKRKVKENPLVPIGMGLTVAALVSGLRNFMADNKSGQQRMMRARVFAQGGTIVALTVGLYLAASRHNAERKAEQKQ